MNHYLDFEDDEYNSNALPPERTAEIFLAQEDRPQLEATRLYAAKSSADRNAMAFKTEIELRSSKDILDLKHANDPLQIFTIRQARSWTTLDISFELYTAFTAAFNVFPPFRKCVETFGVKCDEHECEFPGFQSQRTSQLSRVDAFECAYVLRRAELHGRTLSEGQCPWSIRQTAVYHIVHRPFSTSPNHPTTGDPQSKFLLISPSKAVERKIERLLGLASSWEEATHYSVIHSVLVTDSIKGWMGYIAWLEQDLKERSDRITFSKLGAVHKDFTFTVEDRQAIKLTEDAVIDLQTITSTLLNIVEGLRRHCKLCCNAYCEPWSQETHMCTAVSEEFHSHLSEVELMIKRAQSVRDRVVSSAQLLSDLLRYEDQRALKELTEQSATENRTMLSLAEKSTKDAEATKVLTIIGLVYLPTTFVAVRLSNYFVRGCI